VAESGLGRAAGDFFGTVLLFREAPDGYRASVPALRHQLLACLDAFARDPASQRVPPEELAQARFALVAFADETIQLANWAGRDEWLREPLQLQLFHTTRAGDEFYDHLASLRPEQNAARQIFYLCLAFGFQGRYAGHDAERAELMRQHFEMLRAARCALDLASSAPIAPPAYRVEIEVAGGGGRPLWPVFLAWAGATLLLFAVFWFVLRSLASGVATPEGV
jgi:type VI secretion system protein ImpK